jgi:hypothetical protein
MDLSDYYRMGDENLEGYVIDMMLFSYLNSLLNLLIVSFSKFDDSLFEVGLVNTNLAFSVHFILDTL